MNNIYETRLAQVRDNLSGWGVEGLLLGNSYNRRWLSGFTGSTGWLLVTADKAMLGTDSRYWEQASSQAPEFELFELKGHFSDALARFIESAGATHLGLEARYITLEQFEQLSNNTEVSWDKLLETVESFRSVKSREEIETIRRAAAITDATMSQVKDIVKLGMSELELAWELEKGLREKGASGMAFPAIVASGPNGARAHHEPGSRQLQAGDTLIIDMGAMLDGYCSDLSRTFYLGESPDEQFQEIYGLVLKSQEAALSNMTVGLTGKQIDSFSRDVIDAGGFGDEFGHSLGHGLGLAVHEMPPRLSPFADDSQIEENMVVTVEPGIYISEWGGVRIEDLVHFTESGIEFLSKCPKEPIIPV